MALLFSIIASIFTTGLTFGAGYYRLTGFDGTVYAYNTNGIRSSANDFDLDAANGAPRGITYHDDKFWVVDNGAYKVFAYNTNGTRASEYDFDLDIVGNLSACNGITYHDDKLLGCR